jgi:hypothetical protein
VSRWCILRTSGGQTLPLMRSLREAGFDVWTPAKTFRKTIRAKTIAGTRQIEVEAPILTTFVFARESELDELAHLMVQQNTPHPAFSIFRVAAKVPFVGDGSIKGLRDEEQREAEAIRKIRDAETHAEAEQIRIAAIKSASARRRAEQAQERDRRQALRSRRCAVEPGTTVEVSDDPAFVGVTGVLEEIDGPYARVRFGTSSWKIEGWRVMPALLHKNQTPRGLAA